MNQPPRVSDPSSVIRSDRHSRGSTLVFLIVLMVVFALLGVGMLSMFGSSVLSVFSTNSARRANYMAESGLRYAISEVRNAPATTAAREAALAAIDDGINVKWFDVTPGTARFRVRVFPYWSKTTTTGTGITTLAATVPNSGFPPGYAIPGVGGVARLQVGPNNLVGISSVTGDTPGSKAVTYTLASAVTIPAGLSAYVNLAYPTANTSQTVTKGSAATPLVLNINAVDALPIPPNDGLFTDNATGRRYSYQTARLDISASPHTVILENIGWPGASATATFPAGSYLVFPPAARLEATGDATGGIVHTQRDNATAVTLFGIDSAATMPGPNQSPPALSTSESGFSGDLGALDLTKSGSRVIVQGYIATGGTHAYWAAMQHLGEAGYRFPDPEQPERDIGWHVVPIANDISDNLRNTWMQYNGLSYDVQIKNGWDLNKDSGGSGIAFRWHESPLFEGQVPAGNDPYRYYQGYGLTFMLYKSDDDGSSDLIPNSIKPGGGALKKKLLLVLWEQKVDAGGVPRKDWLAYALLGNPEFYWYPPWGQRTPADPDQKITGYQVWPDGRLNDNATVVVRVVDRFVTSGGVTTRCNDIKVFYGEASEYTFVNDSRTKDAVATNKQRARYYPRWLETGDGGTLSPINPQWPTNQFGLNANSIAYWEGNGTAYDYFSMGSSAPTAPFNTVTWVKNTSPATGFSAVNLLNDNGTIRTTDFTLDSFPSGRKELGLVGMGDISGPQYTVAFDDFYIQMLGGSFQ